MTQIREPTQRSRCDCGTSCPCREIHRQQSNSTTPRTRTRRNRSPEGHGTRSRRWNYREQTNATYSPPDLGGRSRSPERFSSSSRSRRRGPIQESRNSGERVDDPFRRNSNRIGEGRTNGEYSASRRYRGRRFYRRGFNRAVNSYHRAFADDNSLPRSSGSDYVSEGVDSEDYPDSSTQYTQRRRDGPNNGDRRSRMDRAQRY
ncbi:hypothetical protein F5887DRAFT_520655 [Amanita rubescens]|nr:hypothetical protein F5887DRAFT_520655 [Amanita rubescens]